VTPRPLDLGEEVRQAVDAFAPLARERRATLRANVGGDLVGGDLRVLADPGALRQMVLNLLDNAVKYAPPGRTVTVGVAGVGGRARVWVDDEGPGVPPAERERIWEPYVRLARGTDAPIGGTGIGLAIVRELAVLNGGWAWVQRAPSGGARFIVELPRIVDGQAAAPELAGRASAGGGAGA
jgi:signal transduction histidine kinase